MNGLDFLENINDIDDELIDAAARKWTATAVTVNRRPWIFIVTGAAIAAAILLMVIGLSTGGGRKPGGDGTAVVSVNESTRDTESETTTVKETATTRETTTETTSSQITTEEKAANSTNDFPDNPGEVNEQEQDYYDSNDEPEYEPEADDEPVYPEYRVIAIEIAYSEEMDDDDSSDDAENVLFWEDSEHMYYMDAAILNMATVIYENGEFEDLVSALNNGHLDISDLDAFEVPYYTD